uniref:Uncharacterized protein n=1 Tax=Arundo donax TaxID=35708 RepID=A0A0A8YJ94_ARUDO
MKTSRNFHPTYSKYQYFWGPFSIKQRVVINNEARLPATLLRGDDPELEAGGVGGEDALEKPSRGGLLLGRRRALPAVELAEAAEVLKPPIRAPDLRSSASDDNGQEEREEAGRHWQSWHRGCGVSRGRGGKRMGMASGTPRTA